MALKLNIIVLAAYDWAGAVLRVNARYLKNHKRLPNLITPQRYTEKMQWRKLFDLNPLYTVLSDKIAVRDFVSSIVGDDQLVPCLWTGFDPDDIPFDNLLPPYVIKSAHGTGQTIIVDGSAPVDRPQIRQVTRSWLRHCHGLAKDEPGYIGVPRRLIIEKLLLDQDGEAPIELKAYVFDGKVRTILTIAIDNQSRERFRSHFTADWVLLPWSLRGEAKSKHPIPRPSDLARIISIAERLGSKLDHIRVDMYLCNSHTYVGEITLYSQSGMSPFSPDEADHLLGSYWQILETRRRAWTSIIAGRRRIRSEAVGTPRP